MHTPLTMQAAPESGEQVASLALIGSALLVLLVYAVLFIAALISIIVSSHTGGMKLAWLVFVVVAPFLGSVLWFLVGRGDAMRREAVAIR